MRKLLFGLFGFAALGFGALSAQPAEAQPYYPGYGRTVVEYRTRPAYRPVVEYRRAYRRPYRDYRPYRPYGYYRPAFVGPRCYVRPERVWNGYRWIRRPVRICRY